MLVTHGIKGLINWWIRNRYSGLMVSAMNFRLGGLS